MDREISQPIVDQILELTYNSFKAQREEQHLDPEKLKEFIGHYIKPLYPYVIDEERQNSKRRYRCCQICGTNPGRFCCCSSITPDQNFSKLGLGLCLYFKFLKHANWFFLIIALLSLTACGVCYAVSVQNDFQTTKDYTTFLFSLGYGTFSSQHVKCNYAIIDQNKVNIAAKCPYGMLNATVVSRLPVVFTKQSRNTLYNCRNERKSAEAGTYLVLPFVQSIQTFINTSDTQNFTLLFNGSQTFKIVSYVYECYNNVYNINGLSTISDNFFLYVVLVDLVFCVFYVLFLCSETRAEQDEIKFFNKEQVALDSFSVMVKGVNRSELDAQLHGLLDYFHAEVSPRFKQSIVNITIPSISAEMDQQQQRMHIYQSFYNLIDKYYFRNFSQLLKFEECHQIVTKDVQAQQLVNMRSQIKKLARQLLSLSRKQAASESNEQISLYIVFDNVVAKKTVMDCMQKYCYSKKLVCKVGGKDRQFELQTPPVPDSIIWQNRSKWMTKLKTLIMWILTLAICFGSYVLFGFIQYKQSQLLSTYNYNIDCAVLFPGKTFVVFDPTLADQPTYQTCYCDGKSLLDVVSSQTNQCIDWQKEYIVYNIIPLLISLGIVIFNIIVSRVFVYLTKFQRHRFVHSYELSYAFKRAFMLVLNMGLILILLNLNYNNSTFLQEANFLFLGKYNDFTPDWYDNIGTIITLTLIFNITFPIIELLLAYVLKCFKRCWDTRCCYLPTTRKTKKQYTEYFNDEVYPIGERYAFLMATFFVAMSFCGIIPILVPVTAILMVLLYNIDKILIFRYYQTPLNYTPTLHKAFLVVLYASMISHCALTSYFLSEPSLIATSSYIPGTGSSVDSGNARLDNMIKTGYIIPYVALFIFLVIFAFFKEFILRFFRWLCNCCCCFSDEQVYADKSELVQKSKIYTILSEIQRENLQVTLERSLQYIQFKKKQNLRLDLGVLEAIVNSYQAQVNVLNIQEEIIKNSIKQLSKEVTVEPKLKLLGLPTYEAHSKLEEIQKERRMLKFEKKLKEIVSTDIIKGLTDNFVVGAGNQSRQNLNFTVSI